MSFRMSFNNTTLPLRIRKVSGRGPIQQEVVRQVRITGGSHYVKSRLLERVLTVDYAILTSGLEDNRAKIDALNSILFVKEPVPIVFSDEPTKTYYGILDGTQDFEEMIFKGEGNLVFLCPDPYKYGTERTYTLSSSPIVNGGTASTDAIFTATFTASATEFKITHQQTGKFVRVIWNFVQGDVLVIDLSKRKITINNNLQMAAYDWMSQPFQLQPGNNNFTLTPSNVTTTQIKFKPRWF